MLILIQAKSIILALMSSQEAEVNLTKESKGMTSSGVLIRLKLKAKLT